MMFADAATDPVLAYKLWLIAQSVVMFILAIVTIWALVTNKKQKREVSFSFEPANKLDFDAHVVKNDREHDEIWKTLRSEDKELRDQLARAFSDFERTIGRIEGTLKKVEESLQMMVKESLRHGKG